MEKFIQVISLSWLDNIDLSLYDGVYFGVDSCAFKNKFDDEILDKSYFLKYKKLLQNKKLVFETSLVPHFVEDKFFSLLKLIIDVFAPNLEVSINDFGVYHFLKKEKLLDKVQINIGPNFYYHVKDPYASIIHPEKFKHISIDKQFYKQFYENMGFVSLEFFYPLHGLEFKFLEFKNYLFYPYVQYSFTRACPWSLAKAGEKVSKLILDCKGCDRNYYKQQVKQKLKWKDLLVESIYVPNAQYYDLSKVFSIDDIKLKLDRVIYNDLLINNVTGSTER